jgi:hypothetical protein
MECRASSGRAAAAELCRPGLRRSAQQPIERRGQPPKLGPVGNCWMRWDLAAQLVDLESRLPVLARVCIRWCTIARNSSTWRRGSHASGRLMVADGRLLSGNGSVQPVDSP